MDKPISTPRNTLRKGQSKDRHFRAQMKLVYTAFHKQPKTMLMVSIETGILRANICRYVADWKRQGKIRLVKFGFCNISKHVAGYYTTNPKLYPAIVEPSNTDRP